MTDQYTDWSAETREDMIYDKDKLLAPLKEEMKQTPIASKGGDYRKYTGEGLYKTVDNKS
jgi:hypothetical protein